MVRIKMPLKLIELEKHRNSTFMKRRAVIKKKAMELARLCDITTLLVCFGPRGQLETWPENRQEVQAIIDLYRSLKPDECIKRRYDLASFFEAHLKKLEAELNRQRDAWLDSLPVGFQPEELAQSLDSKLAAIGERIGHLRLEGENRGKEIEVRGHHQHSQLQHVLLEESPPAGGDLPLDTVLDARPIQSFQGMELPEVKREEFTWEFLLGHASAPVWEAPHDSQISEMPCSLPHPSLGPHMLPMVADHSFDMDMMGHLDDPIFSNPFLAMDFSTYPVAGVSYTSSVVDPTVGFPPLPLCHDTSIGGGGIRNLSMSPFDNALGAGYDYPLRHLPSGNPATMCNEVYHHQDGLYGADVFFQGWDIAHPLAEAWSSSRIFHDLPPNRRSSSSGSVEAVAPGGNDPRYVPTSATNPFAQTGTRGA